ncbi:MAG TPA: LEA type 2 family protein, partial [Fodinibius sp.]|nr:LEA type 2 family protein [Fodinibius sp.]
MKKIVSIILFTAMLAGCQTVKDIANSIQKPSLSVEDVRVTGFNFREMELTYSIKVNNPNPVAIRMLGYDYSLGINEHSFLKGDQTKKVNIEASDESIFQVPMTVNFEDLYNTVKGVAGREKSSYSFLSHLAFELPVLGHTEIPVRKEGEIPMIKLPKLSVQNL